MALTLKIIKIHPLSVGNICGRFDDSSSAGANVAAVDGGDDNTTNRRREKEKDHHGDDNDDDHGVDTAESATTASLRFPTEDSYPNIITLFGGNGGGRGRQGNGVIFQIDRQRGLYINPKDSIVQMERDRKEKEKLKAKMKVKQEQK